MKTYSQELRFTSPSAGAFSWIAGAYYVHTDRFISTGNLVDRGLGVPAVYQTPPVDPANPYATNTNVTFLADSQSNNAWAVFADAAYEFTPQWEIDAAIRYDEDHRQNTTDTPTQFLPTTTASTGEVRRVTYSASQPKATLRYKPNDDWTFYGGWSRGFRSGGFNQTGVGAVARANGVLGVNDTFNAEIADTTEIGFKSLFLDRRLSVDGDVFYTKSTNGYFFVYIAADSTQNLGNLNATYKGAELSLTARPTDRVNLYASYGYTDSRITAMADPTVIGNQAPLVSRNTANAGVQYRQPLIDGLNGTTGWTIRKSAVPGGNLYNIVLPLRTHPRWRIQARAASGEMDDHRLVEESHQHCLQCRVLTGQRRRRWIPVARSAAPLRSRFGLPLLIGR